MAYDFRSPHYCLNHAERHIQSFSEEMKKFVDSSPFKRVMEFDPNGPRDIHKIILEKEMPEALSGISADIVLNLRASLDQSMHAIGMSFSGKGLNFPIRSGENDFLGLKDRIVKRASEEIFNTIYSLNPYQGGDNLLWEMNSLCNSQKHEIITPIATYARMESAYIKNIESSHNFSFPPKWDPENQQMILAIVDHRTEASISGKIIYQIVIAKEGNLSGLPALDVFKKMHERTQKIVDALEQESTSLGIISS
ncbi:hypothetical protein FZZ93_01015 [Halomonas eurihalina]|uniref:Uncharacterized protein n=1 Tax=Halomonas eurihalina TaxID=42566 RepID=A0A5D9DF39_HALER|nr:hypothetical protein [Halomonas eurihalina]MDR5858228.1 hypothetical protein [Halomonas eurihalina]TZG41275.1 hypothetical protein FZZ93_01015 [Halomonas eurihalina]